MRPSRISLQLHVVGWLLVSAMTASGMDGMLCRSRPQDDEAMACCHQETGDEVMAPSSVDCCRPSRTADAQGELLAATKSTRTERPNGFAVELPSWETTGALPGVHSLIPAVREFPDRAPIDLRSLPLLI